MGSVTERNVRIEQAQVRRRVIEIWLRREPTYDFTVPPVLSSYVNVLYTVNENRVFLLKQEFCFSNHSQSVSVYSAFGRSVGEA